MIHSSQRACLALPLGRFWRTSWRDPVLPCSALPAALFSSLSLPLPLSCYSLSLLRSPVSCTERLFNIGAHFDGPGRDGPTALIGWVLTEGVAGFFAGSGPPGPAKDSQCRRGRDHPASVAAQRVVEEEKRACRFEQGWPRGRGPAETRTFHPSRPRLQLVQVLAACLHTAVSSWLR